VLDAGGGLGQGAWFLARLGAQVTGVDVSADAIAWAADHYLDQSLGKRGSLAYAVADLTTWQPPGEYDAIVLTDVLEHFPQQAGPDLLRRLLGGLRPGAVGLFLHLPITANALDWLLLIKNRLLWARLRGAVLDHHGDPTHRARYAVASAAQTGRAAGARVVRLELRVYRPRLRPLERAVLAQSRLSLRARAAAQLITDFDAVLLPELDQDAALHRSEPAARS